MVEEIVDTFGKVAMVACKMMSIPMVFMIILIVVATIESQWKNRDAADIDGSNVSDCGVGEQQSGSCDRMKDCCVLDGYAHRQNGSLVSSKKDRCCKLAGSCDYEFVNVYMSLWKSCAWTVMAISGGVTVKSR